MAADPLEGWLTWLPTHTYLSSVTHILELVQSQDEAPLKRWIQIAFNLREEHSSPCLQFLTDGLGLLTLTNGSHKLSPLGQEFLTADPWWRKFILLRVLNGQAFGIGNIVELCVRSCIPLSVEDVHSLLLAESMDWGEIGGVWNRIKWLNALSCLEEVLDNASSQSPPTSLGSFIGGGRYQLTSFGNFIYEYLVCKIQPTIIHFPGVTPYRTSARKLQAITIVDVLAARLTAAIRDGRHYRLLEASTAAAFSYLGFGVEHLGGSGETDVLAQAQFGIRRYKLIVDAKSRREGVLDGIEPTRLLNHKVQYQADYVVVLAEHFRSGQTMQFAEEYGIVLLTAEQLIQLLHLHEEAQFSLALLEQVFVTPGLIKALPSALLEAHNQRRRWKVQLIESIQQLYYIYHGGYSHTITWDAVRMGLFHHRQSETSFADAEQFGKQILEWLTHPILGIATGDPETGFTIDRDCRELSHILRALADEIEQAVGRH